MNLQNAKSNLKNKWGIDPFGFWIPLGGNIIENTMYFNMNDFEENFGYDKLNQIVNEINLGNIYELDEFGGEKCSLSLSIKDYSQPDIFYTNENADWVIYQTHENTIAFAGLELIGKIKSSWKNWQEMANPWS